MSSAASSRRLTISCKLRCVPLSPAQQWGQVMRHKRTATTFSAEVADGSVVRERHARNQGNSYGAANPNHRENRISLTPDLRNFEAHNLRRPANVHSRLGTPGLGNGRNQAGDTITAASLDSTYLGRADDVDAIRSAYNDTQETHFRYGANAGVLNQDSIVSQSDRALPVPDAAIANAGVMNRMPSNSPFPATIKKPSSDIPQQQNGTSLAQEYHVRKAQIHASLWQQEIRKQAGDLERNSDLSSDSLISNSNSRESKGTLDWDANKIVTEDWERFDPPDGVFDDESSTKEEALMFEEFEKRRERNRIQIASFVKQHLYGRRRPVDGWKYIIDNFGMNNKAAKGSALGGRHTTGNDLEKLALKRESGRLHRKA